MNRFLPNLGCGCFLSCSTDTWYPKAEMQKVFCDVITSVLCIWHHNYTTVYMPCYSSFPEVLEDITSFNKIPNLIPKVVSFRRYRNILYFVVLGISLFPGNAQAFCGSRVPVTLSSVWTRLHCAFRCGGSLLWHQQVCFTFPAFLDASTIFFPPGWGGTR